MRFPLSYDSGGNNLNIITVYFSHNDFGLCQYFPIYSILFVKPNANK